VAQNSKNLRLNGHTSFEFQTTCCLSHQRFVSRKQERCTSCLSTK